MITIKDYILSHIEDVPYIKRFELLVALRIKFGGIITDRGMRVLVKELVAAGHPIGSSEKGYFLVKTEADREQVKIYVKKKIFGLWEFYNNIDKAYIKSNPNANPQLNIFTELEKQTQNL